MCYPIELWNEKITDSINYLLLLAAAVREAQADMKYARMSDCKKENDE